jgi:hypothetical protein
MKETKLKVVVDHVESITPIERKLKDKWEIIEEPPEIIISEDAKKLLELQYIEDVCNYIIKEIKIVSKTCR